MTLRFVFLQPAVEGLGASLFETLQEKDGNLFALGLVALLDEVAGLGQPVGFGIHVAAVHQPDAGVAEFEDVLKSQPDVKKQIAVGDGETLRVKLRLQAIEPQGRPQVAAADQRDDAVFPLRK